MKSLIRMPFWDAETTCKCSRKQLNSKKMTSCTVEDKVYVFSFTCREYNVLLFAYRILIRNRFELNHSMCAIAYLLEGRQDIHYVLDESIIGEVRKGELKSDFLLTSNCQAAKNANILWTSKWWHINRIASAMAIVWVQATFSGTEHVKLIVSVLRY